jgi:hypothetical protein
MEEETRNRIRIAVLAWLLYAEITPVRTWLFFFSKKNKKNYPSPYKFAPYFTCRALHPCYNLFHRVCYFSFYSPQSTLQISSRLVMRSPPVLSSDPKLKKAQRLEKSWSNDQISFRLFILCL